MRAGDTATTRAALGRVGIWSSSIRIAPAGVEAAAELESLGVPALWVPGGIDSGVLKTLERLLAATSGITFGTGIINIWKHEPREVAAWWRRRPPEHRARLFLGLGVSHGPIIGEAWEKPVEKMDGFLDGLLAGGVPSERLCVAALGPKMLALAGKRTAGAHPYMVSARHTAFARRTMGPGAVLAPELGVVLDPDPAAARGIAREFVRHYAQLPNYANNWRRDGFTDAEIAALDDRLIDDLIACGDHDAVAARITAHLAAGADHVCLQVIGPAGLVSDLDHDSPVWRALAPLLAQFNQE